MLTGRFSTSIWAGEQVYPFADALAALDIQFLFATGYGRVGVSARYPTAQVLAKPYGQAELAAALETIRGAGARKH